MPKSVRIWYKKQLRLDTLTFRQRDMVQIGAAGLLSVKRRLSEARGPTDAPAKPLTKRYAIYKSKLRKGKRRDLHLTGQLLGGLLLRTVSDKRAYAAPDARIRKEYRKRDRQLPRLTNKQVGNINTRREPWLVFSPVNRQAVMRKAHEVFLQAKARLLKWGNTA